jgi:glucose/mannose-6-phosphate isomerase
MLDDLKLISEIDKSEMLKSVENFSKQIKESKDIVDSADLSSIFKVDNIVVSGMGASAISGDIIQSLYRERSDIPIFATRQYDLPKWANKNTLVLSQSYSGNTEETLSTFKHACQKHCKIIGISSGGKLQEYCEKRQVPHIKIPSGFQPRAATGYMLFSSIYALNKTGVITHDMVSEIKETIGVVEDFSKQNNRNVVEKENLSKQIAKKIVNKIPRIYGWDFYTPIAKRWCTQFNENSKIIASFYEASEASHNDIVGWSMNPEASKNYSCILFRDHEGESIYMAAHLSFMKELFEGAAGAVLEIPVFGKKRLAKMMYLMQLGDFVSCYLAILRKIDPTPVSVIIELKEKLARL